MSGVPLINNFVLASLYLIFLVSPVSLQLLSALTQVKTLSDA